MGYAFFFSVALLQVEECRVSILLPNGLVMAETEDSVDDEGPSSQTVRLPVDLVEMARFICFHRRGPKGRRIMLSRYLDSKLRQAITDEYHALQEEIARAAQSPPKSKRRTPPS